MSLQVNAELIHIRCIHHERAVFYFRTDEAHVRDSDAHPAIGALRDKHISYYQLPADDDELTVVFDAAFVYFDAGTRSVNPDHTRAFDGRKADLCDGKERSCSCHNS